MLACWCAQGTSALVLEGEPYMLPMRRSADFKHSDGCMRHTMLASRCMGIEMLNSYNRSKCHLGVEKQGMKHRMGAL